MSVAQVKLYCTNCGIKRTYNASEEVPRQCPQCQRYSRPKYVWLRNKLPFLPALVSLGLLFSLSLYDLFVTKAETLPWLPYDIFALLFFSLPWMVVTLLKDWPKPPKGPHIVSEIKWLRQDASPQELVGLKILVILEGRYPRKRFVSVIEGYRSILMEIEEDGWENDRVYILRSDQNPLEATHILFHPNWVRFKRGAQHRLRKECKGAFSYRPSMEELLLNKERPLREIYGIVYKTQNPDTLTSPQIPWSLLTVMTSAYGRVGPSWGNRP